MTHMTPVMKQANGQYPFNANPTRGLQSDTPPKVIIEGFNASFENSRRATHQLNLALKALPFNFDDYLLINFEYETNDHVKVIAEIELPNVNDLVIHYRTASNTWHVGFGKFDITFQEAQSAADLLLEILKSHYFEPPFSTRLQ